MDEAYFLAAKMQLYIVQIQCLHLYVKFCLISRLLHVPQGPKELNTQWAYLQIHELSLHDTALATGLKW